MKSPFLDLLVTIAAGGMLLGVIVLLIVLLRVHRVQSRIHKEAQYPGADYLLKHAKEARDAAIRLPTRRLASTDAIVTKVLWEIDSRLEVLDDAHTRVLRVKALLERTMVDLKESYSAKDGDLLNLAYAQGNIEILERVERLICELRGVDEATRTILMREDDV